MVISTHNEVFRQVSPEEDFLFTFYRKPKPLEQPNYLTASQALAKISEHTRTPITTFNAITLGRTLAKSGFKQLNRAKRRVFEVVELSFDQVKANNRISDANTEYSTKSTDNKEDNSENRLPF